MYNEPIIKKKKKIPKGLFIMLTVFGLVLTLGLTYAYFIYEEQGNSHELIAGSLYMNSTNSGNVSLTGLYPMTNKDGIENGIKYNFTVEGHNLTDKDIYYGVYVNKGSEVANKTRFKDSDIKLYLTETINNVTTVVYGPDTLEEFNRSLIYAKTIDANLKKENAIDISYELTMWLDEKVLISDTVTELEGRSIYTSEQFKNSYASIKLEVYGDFEEKKGPYNYMMASPWSSGDIYNQRANIKEVHFVSIKQDEIDTRYEASTIKQDVTDTKKGGSVKAWLETDTTDTTKYIMYVASEGTTFFPSNSSSMFLSYSAVTSIIFENVNTKFVTDMSNMFNNCSGLTSLDIADWDTSSVSNMSYMFCSCSGLTTLDIGNWDTSSVSTMTYMFDGCSKLITLDIGNWDTSNVTNMSKMFQRCVNLTSLNIGNWDTSLVSDMSIMFAGCSSLKSLDIGAWDTSSVTSMQSMFGDCKNLTTLDIGDWDTGLVSKMAMMFLGCSNLTSLDISNFTFDSVTSYTYIFDGMKARTDNTPTIIVKDTTAQNWVLALTGYDRPESWTVDNVVLKSSVQ